MKSVDLPHSGASSWPATPAPARRRSPSTSVPGRGDPPTGPRRRRHGHLDFEPEEQKRRQSLSLAVGTFDHDGHEITLVDTPGYRTSSPR
jgi:hypothetical protein